MELYNISTPFSIIGFSSNVAGMGLFYDSLCYNDAVSNMISIDRMRTVYSLIIGIFFSLLLYYLTDYALLPYNDNSVLDVKNLFVVSVSFVLGFTGVFSFLHQVIDKLFFRKFYERAKVSLAVRRGVLISLVLVGIAWLRIFGYWEWHIITVVIVLGILIEALFISISSGMTSKKKQVTNSI